MPSISEDYRKKFLERQKGFDRKYLPIFNKVAKDVARLVSDPSAKYVRGFNYDRARGMQKKLGEVMVDFQRKTINLTRDEMVFSWNLGTEKTTVAVNDYLRAFKNLSPDKKPFVPDIGDLQKFMSNMRNANNLSESVWRVSNQYRWELQTHLALGIMNGDSSAQIAQRIQRYLNNPDDLFRRVRNKQGRLAASERMKDYHPGRGVYRSAYKNALRVARTETNRAYFMSDHNRWKDNGLVIGFRVFLSDQHPDYKFIEICEELAGDYPKEFVFTGWHPQCLCHVTPIMVDKKDFRAYLRGEQTKPTGMIVELPENFKNFLDNNLDRLQNYKSVPYFIADNKALIEKTMKQREGTVKMLHKIKNADSLNIIKGEIKSLRNKYKLNVETIGDLSPTDLNGDWAALVVDPNTLLLNAKHWNARNYAAVLTEEVEPTWFAVPTKKGTIDHELGHMITFNAMEKGGRFKTELMKLWQDYGRETSALRKRVGTSTLMKMERDLETYKGFFISGLAELAPEEFIAESFTTVLNNKFPNIYAVKVVELINRYFKRK